MKTHCSIKTDEEILREMCKDESGCVYYAGRSFNVRKDVTFHLYTPLSELCKNCSYKKRGQNDPHNLQYNLRCRSDAG